MTPAERMATARRALERAEAAAGLRTRLAAPLRLADDAAAPPARPAPGRAAGEDAAGPPTTATGPVGGGVADHLPVPAALAGFFPAAGLRRGSVVQVGGSASLLLALVAAAQGEGWVALAALPDLGLQAAAEAGVALERCLFVPRTGPESAAVVGALVDGVDVLAVGDCRALGARDRRLLSARLRSRGAVLLSTAHWPGADVVLRAGQVRTEGLGRGWGSVRAGEMTVHGRSRNGVAGRVRLRVGASGLDVVDDGALHGPGPVPEQVPAAQGPGPRLQAVS